MIDERRAGNEVAVVRTQDYNAVMQSWAMSRERGAAAVRVEEILTMMQDMYEAGDAEYLIGCVVYIHRERTIWPLLTLRAFIWQELGRE